MLEQLRNKLNEAPPWVTYSVVGVVVVVAVGAVVLTMEGSDERSSREKHFYFEDTDDGITVSAEDAREMLHEAAKANPTGRGLVKNPKTGKYTGVIGRKCPKCGKYFVPPEKPSSIFPDSWRDECPKCGYSDEKEKAIQAAFQQKKQGTYDPEKLPAFIREAVEEAEKSGKYDHLK